MKGNVSCTAFAVLYLIALPCLLPAQTLYVDPAASTLAASAPGVYQNSEPVLLGVAADAWTVTCTAEPLVHTNGSAQIPITALFLKHDLADDFQPLTTALDLGSGNAPVSPYNAIINHLTFQARLEQTEPAGTYTGQIHFYDLGVESALLTLTLVVAPEAELVAAPASFSFYCSNPDYYASEQDGLLTVSGSNFSDWHVEAALTYSSAPVFFNGSTLFIKSALADLTGNWGAGEGFQPLELVPVLLAGEQVGANGSTEFCLRLRSDWGTPTGSYQAIIEFSIPEINIKQQVTVQIEVTQYTIFSLSESSIYFHANGPPSIWNGDKTVKLTVGCNSNEWSAYCEATPLVSPNDQIPNERLFIRIEPGDFNQDGGAGMGFQNMSQTIEVAKGGPSAPKEVAEMWFRLKTIDADLPGHYEGSVTFSLFANP